MIDVILDTLLDGVKILPFLFLTYLLLEFIEHRAKEKTEKIMRRSGALGPMIGGALGAIPQCGFSASASNLYAENIITAGTLIAVFLSTSDEMLPVMIGAAPAGLILKVLGLKILIGITVGLAVDLFLKLIGKSMKNIDIESFCHDENCGCEEGSIFRSATVHTAKILGFILVITFALNTLIYFVGEERLGNLISGLPVFVGPIVTALVGLIPNCAGSVVITELYLGGVITTGSMLAGLLAGSGVGMLVLFKVCRRRKANAFILLTTYGAGVLSGIVADLVKLTF